MPDKHAMRMSPLSRRVHVASPRSASARNVSTTRARAGSALGVASHVGRCPGPNATFVVVPPRLSSGDAHRLVTKSRPVRDGSGAFAQSRSPFRGK